MENTDKQQPKEKDKFFPNATDDRWTADHLMDGIKILPDIEYQAKKHAEIFLKENSNNNYFNLRFLASFEEPWPDADKSEKSLKNELNDYADKNKFKGDIPFYISFLKELVILISGIDIEEVRIKKIKEPIYDLLDELNKPLSPADESPEPAHTPEIAKTLKPNEIVIESAKIPAKYNDLCYCIIEFQKQYPFIKGSHETKKACELIGEKYNLGSETIYTKLKPKSDYEPPINPNLLSEISQILKSNIIDKR